MFAVASFPFFSYGVAGRPNLLIHLFLKKGDVPFRSRNTRFYSFRQTEAATLQQHPHCGLGT